jgi:pimeloyl-ACP methyl ester carboxylesterase
VSSARERLLAFRKSGGHPPRLTRHTVAARGLAFAVYTSPPVEGAPPLCCVNGGLLFDHRILWPALAPLARRRQLVLYDQRGRGASQVPPGVRAARIEHDAGDLPALRAALGIERWDVLGHSWGGGIAMLGVSQDQAATRRLVLVDPVGATSAWLPGLHEAALRHLRNTPSEAYPDGDSASAPAALAALDPATLSTPDPVVHSAYARAFYPAWFADPSLPAMFAPPRSSSVTGATVAARLRRDGYDWRDVVRALPVPSLVIHGEQDVLAAENSRQTVSLLPDARLELLADAGHLPFWEAPDRFFALVEAFLAPPPADTPQHTG